MFHVDSRSVARSLLGRALDVLGGILEGGRGDLGGSWEDLGGSWELLGEESWQTLGDLGGILKGL